MSLTLESIGKLRPSSVVGGITNEESYFLYNIIKTFNPKTVCELGVASGWSTSVILWAINELITENPESDYQYSGIDIDTHCYFDRSLEVGFLVPELIEDSSYVGTINRGKDLTHFGDEFNEGEIDLIFIDANHKHPYPAVDLLAAIPFIKDNSVVVLHDTNLPLVNADFPSHGAKYLYDGISTQFKFNCPATVQNHNISNMGALVVNDKKRLIADVTQTIHQHEFEMKAEGPYVDMLTSLQTAKAA